MNHTINLLKRFGVADERPPRGCADGDVCSLVFSETSAARLLVESSPRFPRIWPDAYCPSADPDDLQQEIVFRALAYASEPADRDLFFEESVYETFINYN